MENTKQQIVDTIKSTNNILVTVSNNPSVDELAAALGLTIILNNLDKRVSAVFSGLIPPAMSFLEPNKTFEPSAESLRDFIIALDKEKADHLRYKVEGDVVKIFITPYRRVLTEKDLVFSQGDYNIELVIAIGVTDQKHLDKALQAQGNILHGASIVTVTSGKESSTLGNLDWHDEASSSLSEMAVSIVNGLKADKPLFDQQTATAFLTGIVSATERFSNVKTTSQSMSIAAQLMAAGANQQLIAAKLIETHDIIPSTLVANKSNGVKNPYSKPQDNVFVIDRTNLKQSKDSTRVPDALKDTPLPKTAAETTAIQTEPPESVEAKLQRELDSKLHSLALSSTASMEDIEKQLHEEMVNQSSHPSAGTNVSPVVVDNIDQPQEKEASAEPPKIGTTNPNSTNIGDSNQNIETVPPQLVESEKVDSEEIAAEVKNEIDAPHVQVIDQPERPKESTEKSVINNNHGKFTAPSEPPVINGILSDPYEGEPPSVDPFGGSITQPNDYLQKRIEVTPIAPNIPPQAVENNGNLTSEIKSNEALVGPMGIPELPPLPPLPIGTDLSPLPLPPPPPPVLGQTPTTSLSGAVSGDIFGDNNTLDSSSGIPQSQQNRPTEPGLFRIPGSAN